MEASFSNISSTSEILGQSLSVISNTFEETQDVQSFASRPPILSSTPSNLADGQHESDGQPAEKRIKVSSSLFPDNGTHQSSSELLFKQQEEVNISPLMGHPELQYLCLQYGVIAIYAENFVDAVDQLLIFLPVWTSQSFSITCSSFPSVVSGFGAHEMRLNRSKR